MNKINIGISIIILLIGVHGCIMIIILHEIEKKLVRILKKLDEDEK